MADEPVIQPVAGADGAAPSGEPRDQKPAVPATDDAAASKPGDGADGTDPDSAAGNDNDEKDANGQPKKKLGGFQKRLERLSGKVTAAEKEAAYWREKALGTQPAPKPAEAAAEPKAKPVRPKPEDFRIGDTDQFDAVKFEEAREKWEEETIDWKLEQKESAREKAKADAELKKQRESVEQTLTREYEERSAKAAEAIPDFVEKSEECFATLKDVAPDAATAPEGARVIGDVLLRRDPSGQLEYYLGSHPEEIERIAPMDTADAHHAIAEIRVKLATAPEPEPDEEADAEPAAASKAPPPLTPNRKSAAAVQVMPGQPGSDKLPDAEWFARRRKQRQAKQNFAPKR
jgi:hypothetical protein